MNDKDYSPLTPATVRALADKLYEKRKSAALDIEKMVREYHQSGNTTEIRRLLKILGQEFAASTNPNPRKGGLIGLAASAIALGKDSGYYIADLVKPVVACFSDPDSRVRYYACEALYNIVKVSRAATLKYFNDIFDGLSKLTADNDQNVKNGSDLLDRLMKDIVAESTNFDLVAFMPLLRERIYTKNPYARQFLVTWVSVLDAVPDIDMVVYLPEILDGLFHILGDQNSELRKIQLSSDRFVQLSRTGAGFAEFLREIKKSPENVNYAGMINILIAHCQSGGLVDPLIQYTAISWIKEFVNLSGRAMLPYSSGILTAVLPCLAYEDDPRRHIREAAKSVNTTLMKLIVPDDDSDRTSADGSTPDDELFEVKGAEIRLDIGPIVEVLCRHLLHESMQTRIATLRWIYHLHINTPKKAFAHVDETFPLLLKTLTDPSDEVVLLDLEVLSEISSNSAGNDVNIEEIKIETGNKIAEDLQASLQSCHHMNKLFPKFMISLLHLFSTDKNLLDERGSFIIRQLSLLLNAEDIYRTLATTMLREENAQFACQMVQTLNTILLTSTELFELRIQLKELKTEAGCSLFTCLYKAWCHSAVATLSLCLLTQNYQHACTIINMFSEIEVTVDFLTEIDKLVQLIESPIFTFLRLQLLDVQNNQHLLKAMYGLLMLLPQTDAFRTLRHRLECVPPFKFLPREEQSLAQSGSRKQHPDSRKQHPDVPAASKIDFDSLLQHFMIIQEKQRTARRTPRRVRDQGHSLHS